MEFHYSYTLSDVVAAALLRYKRSPAYRKFHWGIGAAISLYVAWTGLRDSGREGGGLLTGAVTFVLVLGVFHVVVNLFNRLWIRASCRRLFKDAPTLEAKVSVDPDALTFSQSSSTAIFGWDKVGGARDYKGAVEVVDDSGVTLALIKASSFPDQAARKRFVTELNSYARSSERG